MGFNTKLIGMTLSSGTEDELDLSVHLGVVLDTASEGPDSLFVQIVTVFVQIVTKNTLQK